MKAFNMKWKAETEMPNKVKATVWVVIKMKDECLKCGLNT